jgi:hypothetical protein
MIEGLLMLVMLLFNYCILLHAKAHSKGRRMRFVSALFDFRQSIVKRVSSKEKQGRA